MEGPGLCVCVCVCVCVYVRARACAKLHALSKCTLPSTSVCSPTWKLSCSSFDVLICGPLPHPRGQGGELKLSAF